MIFILDRQEKVIGVLKSDGVSEGTPFFFDDVLSEDLATGAETFQFSVVGTGKISRDLAVGNFICFKKNGKFKLFQIVQLEENHQEDLVLTVYCEGAGLELINKVFRKRTLNSATLRRFLETVLDETGWSVGFVEGTVVNTLDLELEDSSVYATLQNNIAKFGCELEFRVEIKGRRIAEKYVDVYGHRGKATGKRFEFGKDIEGITRKTDSTQLYTALVGRGTNGLNFRDITVEGIDKPAGQDFVADQESFEKYNHKGYHIMGVFEYETDSPQELLRETYKQLQKCKEIRYEYEVSVALLGELLGEKWNTVGIGDTVFIVDNAFNPPVHLMARVSKLETSFTDPNSDTCTLSNFVEVSSNITDEMRKIASELQGYVEGTISSKFPIGGDDIQQGAISGGHIYENSITTDHLKAELITADKIRADEIKAAHIDADQILAKHIKAGEIVSEHLQSGTITSDKLESNIIKVNSALIQDGAIGTAQIGDAQITNAKIKDLSADKINAGTIDASKINVTNLNANNITSGSISTGLLEIKDMTNLATITQAGNIYDETRITKRDTPLSHKLIPAVDCADGAEFYFELECKTMDSTTSLDLNAMVIMYDSGEGSIGFPKGKLASAADCRNWKRVRATVKVPANTSLVSIRPFLQVSKASSDANSENWLVRNVVVRRKSGGQLIVDGSITGDKIQGNTIKGDHIQGNTISGDKLMANSIQGSHIQAGSIGSDKVVVGTDSQLVTVNENNPVSIEGITFSGRPIIENVDGVNEIRKKDVTSEYLMFSNHTKLRFKTGEKVQVNVEIFNHSSEARTLNFIVWGYDKDKGYVLGNSVSQSVPSKTWTAINKEITLSDERWNNIVYCVVGVSNSRNIQLSARKPSYKKKTHGELIVNGTITGDKLVAGTITGDKIQGNQIQGNHIQGNAITGDKIQANQIQSSHIKASQILASHIKAGEISADKISAGAINTIGLSASEITAQKIASGEIKVGNANIVDGTISGAKISNASITNAQISSLFVADGYIRNLDAGKITSGTLDASRVNVTNLKADNIVAGSITVQGENLIHNTDFATGLDKWSPSGTHTLDTTTKYQGKNTVRYSNTTATSDVWSGFFSEFVECSPGDSFVASAYMKVQNNNSNVYLGLEFYNANRERIGRITDMISTNTDFRKFVVSGRAPSNSKYTRIRMEVQKQATVNGTMFMLSRGTIASEWKPHTDELISSGAITNDKIGSSAITSDKLMIDELFVGDNAFIQSLKAVEIDASSITTGKINSERLDITGLVGFEAFDDDISKVFDVTGDKTYINGGMIATNTIKADKIDLLSGITVKGKDGKNTFEIAATGEVKVNGLLESGNYQKGSVGYRISTDGVAELNQAIVRGDVILPNAGMTNYGATIGNENLLYNSDMLKYTKTSDPWDKNLNGDLRATNWSSGYNGGVENPTTGYHAHLNITQFGFPVFRFVDTDGRWKGVTQGLVHANKIKPGTKYTISFDVYYAEEGLTFIHGGMYTKLTGASSYNFNDGQYRVSNIPAKQWVRFSKTFTCKADTDPSQSQTLYIYGYGGKQGTAYVKNVKLELGESATPWCLAKDEQLDYVRIWAGSNYDGRDNAPFRVTQAGKLWTTEATVGGRVVGNLDAGKVHIHQDMIVINSTTTRISGDEISETSPYHANPNPHIQFGPTQSIINTDTFFGGLSDKKIEFLNENRKLKMYNTDFEVHSKGTTNVSIMSNQTVGVYNGLNLIANMGGGHHVLRHSDSSDYAGTLIVTSEGSQGRIGGDFFFRRKNSSEAVRIVVDGNVDVKDSITSRKHNIEMRSINNEGWGFYAT